MANARKRERGSRRRRGSMAGFSLEKRRLANLMAPFYLRPAKRRQCFFNAHLEGAVGLLQFFRFRFHRSIETCLERG